MKCDFCEFEDNISKLNKHGHPDGWINVKLDSRYNSLHACPKCTRILMVCAFMTNRIASRTGLSGAPNPEALEPFFPDFKRKDDIGGVRNEDS